MLILKLHKSGYLTFNIHLKEIMKSLLSARSLRVKLWNFGAMSLDYVYHLKILELLSWKEPLGLSRPICSLCRWRKLMSVSEGNILAKFIVRSDLEFRCLDF